MDIAGRSSSASSHTRPKHLSPTASTIRSTSTVSNDDSVPSSVSNVLDDKFSRFLEILQRWETACLTTDDFKYLGSITISELDYTALAKRYHLRHGIRDGLANSAGSSLFDLFGSRPNRTQALFETCRTEQTSCSVRVRFEFVRNVRTSGSAEFSYSLQALSNNRSTRFCHHSNANLYSLADNAPEPSRAREHVWTNALGESRAAEQPFMIGNLAEQSLLLAREA